MAKNQNGIKRLNVFAPSKKLLKKAKDLANKVDAVSNRFRNLSDDELSSMTDIFLQKIAQGYSLDDIMVDAFATVREAIYRITGMFAFKVQLMGAAILHWGDFAELHTGEGKTLVCVITAYLNALLKRGVHIVTVNEYLVQVGARFCAECLNPLNISVGYNLADFELEQKKEMYACDVTYTTNSELGFDYLRDNMVKNIQEKVIRSLNFAIVDEGDSVLVDEARTPLIISGQPKRDVSLYVEVDRFAKTLKSDDYKSDPETNSISLTEEGVAKAETFFKLSSYYNIENSDLVHKVKNSLMANYIFTHGVEYVVKNDEIVLVDQFTGRILEGRSYNAGLQQAIQAKEYVKIEPENITVATITYQSLFRLYKKLSALSGTAITEEEEFMKIYNLIVCPVPTNKPIKRVDHPDYVFENKVSKWHHVVAEIERIHATGQPILVGTSSVDDSEVLSNILTNKGINFELLNAKNIAREAEIIKHAGELNAITISTNMAGRGTDIKLEPGVEKLGGLYVIGTERHESRRIDNQLRGRSGRQGDIGETRFFISLQDELFRRFAGDKLSKGNDKIEEDRYDSWFFNRMLNGAQAKIEGINFDSRKNLIDYDSVLSSQRELIYKQRDEILLGKRNADIIKKMVSHVGKEIVDKNLDPKNNLFVMPERISGILNKMIFNAEIILPDYFKRKTSSDATEIISEIIKLSIDIRVDQLGSGQSERILKDILLQNLDYQWTNHLDRIVKVREGVNLRSLEQKSPLNIYIETADQNFNEMKMNIARNTVLAFHKLYVPGVNDKIKQTLAAIAPEIMSIESSTNVPSNVSDIFAKNIKVDIIDSVVSKEKTK